MGPNEKIFKQDYAPELFRTEADFAAGFKGGASLIAPSRVSCQRSSVGLKIIFFSKNHFGFEFDCFKGRDFSNKVLS